MGGAVRVEPMQENTCHTAALCVHNRLGLPRFCQQYVVIADVITYL